MTREEALKILPEMKGCGSEWDTALEVAIEALQQPEQRWIPCSERLPEDDDWKIVTIRDENADRPYLYSDFGWYMDAADCWIVDADQRRDIIAWMPLPEPCKDGGGE